MLNAEAKVLVHFFKKLDRLKVVEQFFYLLQSCLKQLDTQDLRKKLQLKIEDEALILYLGSTEVLRLLKRGDQPLHLDLIRLADGRLFSYAGAAATPQGYSRLTIDIATEELSNALLQEWLLAATQLAEHCPNTDESELCKTGFKAALDLSFRKQLLSYLKQNSAYQDLMEELLPNILQQSSFKKISNSQFFIFQKAIDAFKDFIQTPISPDLAKEFLTAYENYEGSYDKFVKALSKEHPIHNIANQIGRIISYIDGKAAGKKLWNTYEDKRTIAVAVVRQNHWVAQLVCYHQEKQLAELSPNMQHAIRYLETPNQYTAILSERQRKNIAEELLHQTYQKEKFDQQLLDFFSSFEIKTSHKLNHNYLISSILYHPEVTSLWKKDLDYSVQESYYPDELYEAEIPYQLFPSREEVPLNQILYGPPGTGKTYLSIRIAISIVEGLPLDDILQEPNNSINSRLEYYSDQEQIALVSFHQAMSYEDFVEGIKPINLNGSISYQLENGLFKQLAINANKYPNKPYVLIIDEINRGQVAAIFGELITLLEADKRADAPNALSTILPYSKERFTVPQNLYIIGSMNTADRGIEALDIALRRRFHFKEIPPQAQLLSKDMMGINLSKLLETINARIGKLLSTQQAIGHAYFLDIQNIDQLNQCFEYKIIPLLLEYFYQDLAKVGLVLGKAFVKQHHQHTALADFPQEENYTYYSSPYQIRKFPHSKASFITIYE